MGGGGREPPQGGGSELGAGTLDALAKQTGMNRDELLTGLSQQLPALVDHLTPDGRVPTQEEAQRMTTSICLSPRASHRCDANTEPQARYPAVAGGDESRFRLSAGSRLKREPRWDFGGIGVRLQRKKR